MGTEQNDVVTALIHMFTKWHNGKLYKKMAISTFGYRAKDYCAITVQLLGKRQHRHLDTETIQD